MGLRDCATDRLEDLLRIEWLGLGSETNRLLDDGLLPPIRATTLLSGGLGRGLTAVVMATFNLDDNDELLLGHRRYGERRAAASAQRGGAGLDRALGAPGVEGTAA